MNDREPSPPANVEGMGKSMMIIAWIIAIGLAAWFFAGVEERQYNPNAFPSSSRSQQVVKVELLRNKYGHYVTNGKIDGKEVVFLLDTGATDIAIPGALEKYLHLTRGRSFQVNTANGYATAYATEIDYIQIGDIVLQNVRASINPSMQGEDILLGMSALKKVEFRQKGDKLTLIQNFN